MGRTLPSDPRSRWGTRRGPLPPLPFRGYYLRFAPKQAVRHQAGSMGRDSGPGTLGEGKQQNLGGEGPFGALAWRERKGGARPGFVSEQPSPGNPDAGYAALATAAEGRGLRHRHPPRPPVWLRPPGPNLLWGSQSPARMGLRD